MNKTKYMQTDSRWGGLGYPKAPWYVRNCGCGMVSIANVIIEMEKYKKYTPKTIQPYCKQFAAPNGDGTYFAGIPKMLEHYGMTEVKEHATMNKLWAELKKGNRVAIYLMGSNPGGSKRVHWTSGGHFVASVGYKYKDNKHYVYVKDSYSNSSSRNGWLTYEQHMAGDVLRVWSAKLPDKIEAMVKWARSIAKDNDFHYVTYTSDSQTHKCPICSGISAMYDNLPRTKTTVGAEGKPVKYIQKFLKWYGISITVDKVYGSETKAAVKKFQKKVGISVSGIWTKKTAKKAIAILYKYMGWNCIGFAWSVWHNGGGIDNKCNCGVINNAMAERIASASDAEALKLVRKQLGINDVKVIRNNGKNVPQSKWKPGDVCLMFSGSSYTHTFFVMGDGKICDSSNRSDDANDIKVRDWDGYSARVVIRYTGK